MGLGPALQRQDRPVFPQAPVAQLKDFEMSNLLQSGVDGGRNYLSLMPAGVPGDIASEVPHGAR